MVIRDSLHPYKPSPSSKHSLDQTLYLSPAPIPRRAMRESESTTVEMQRSKSTENYGVYDAPEEGDHADAIVGTYIAEEAASELGEFASLTVVGDSDSAGLSLTQDKETSSYGVYSDDADAIEASYISHEVLAQVTGQSADSDSYEVPDSIGMNAEPSDEESFESSADNSAEREAAANALLASDGDSDESETSDSAEEEEVEISDEEIGLAE